MSHIFSKIFDDEIPSVKNMTEKNIEEDNHYKFVEKKSFYNSIIKFLFNFYLKYFMNISLYSNINIIEHTQSYFIPNNIQEKVFQVPPHNKFSIGPIIFKPNKTGKIQSTLFLKNNLTILYPVKLTGEGGGGNIKFINYYIGMSKKKCYLKDEKNFIIEIDENIYEKEIKGTNKLNRIIIIMNVGNLPITIKNMTIDNSNEGKVNDMRILQCKEFILNPKEMTNIDIEIIPNFRNQLSNRIIYFNSEYQTFYLNVITSISQEIYEMKNYLFIYCKCFAFVFILVTMILLSLSKIINIVQKKRRDMCHSNEQEKDDTEDLKDEKKENLIKNELLGKFKNNDNENEKLGYNNNNQNKTKSKQGKKRRNRKKSNSSNNNQKDEIEVINHNQNNQNENKEKEKILNKNTNQNNINNINEEEKNTITNTNQSINKNIEENKIIDNQVNKNEENKNIFNNNKDNDKNENTNNKPINGVTELKKDENEEQKEKKIPKIDIPKQKKRKYKGSIKVLNKKEIKDNDNKIEKEILSDRIELKRDKDNDIISEDKEKEFKKISSEQSNESKKYEKRNNEEYDNNELIDNTNNNYNYNNNNSNNHHKNIYNYKNKRGRYNYKKYYQTAKKYNNNYENNQNNYIYNNYQQQPKKQITKIKKENNAKNLKELFEIEHSKRNELKEAQNNSNSNSSKKAEESKKSSSESPITQKNNSIKNVNNNIIINENNLSNIKLANDEGIEEDFDEELFGIRKTKDAPNYQILNKKLSESINEKNEEMNPIFLNDIKTNNAFEAEQELIKSLKKENKDNKSNNGELSKEDLDIDFSNNSHFNFDYYFFDQKQQENEENDYNGNYEDFKFKSLIDNLNNIETPYNNEDQKGKLDMLLNNNSNKEISEDKNEDEKEDSFKVNEYEQYLLNKNKFAPNFNYYDYDINYNNQNNQNNEDKKFHNKFDEYQKTFGKIGKK